jgi:glycine/serine hydroxymethyltransferase
MLAAGKWLCASGQRIGGVAVECTEVGLAVERMEEVARLPSAR